MHLAPVAYLDPRPVSPSTGATSRHRAILLCSKKTLIMPCCPKRERLIYLMLLLQFATAFLNAVIVKAGQSFASDRC